jgi:PAS domain S-box-containing protein
MVRKSTILAVDDTPANLVALEAVLDRDFDLVFAESGAKAISILEQRADIVVVLMDVQMPIMDGYEAARRIKKLRGYEDVPIIFITAVYHEDPYVKRGYEAGGVDYFSKPFDPDLLRLKLGIYSSFRQKAEVLKERERHLRETEELLKAGRKLTAVLESLPVGVLIADVDGRIFQTNDEVARICKATEVIEHDAYGELLSWWISGGEQLKVPRGPLARALVSGESSHNERIEIRCFDGTAKSILASASPLFGLHGKVVGAVIVIKDISGSQEIAEELETRVARLVSIGVELEQTVQEPRQS